MVSKTISGHGEVKDKGGSDGVTIVNVFIHASSDIALTEGQANTEETSNGWNVFKANESICVSTC